MVGSRDGTVVGRSVGRVLGELVGELVGDEDGEVVGPADGSTPAVEAQPTRLEPERECGGREAKQKAEVIARKVSDMDEACNFTATAHLSLHTSARNVPRL